MRKIFLCGALALCVASTGCANMTPEEKAATAGAVLGGALGLAAGLAAARQPVYVSPAPVYVAPVYVRPIRCTRFGCY